MTHVSRYRLHAVEKSLGDMKPYEKYFSDNIFHILFFASLYFINRTPLLYREII